MTLIFTMINLDFTILLCGGTVCVLVLTLAVIEDDVDIVVAVDAADVGVDDNKKPLLLHVPLLWLHWRMLL